MKLAETHARKNGFRDGPDWSEADLAFLRGNYGRMRTEQLAGALRRTRAAVLTRANVLGLEHGYIVPWTNGDHEALEIAFRHGIAIADLAEALGRKAFSVSNYAKKHGFAFGRRARASNPPTRAAILAMADEEEGEGGQRPTSTKEAHNAAHDDQADGQRRHDHQGDPAVQRNLA